MGLNDKFQNMQIHPTDFLIRFVYSPFDPQVKDQSLAKQRSRSTKMQFAIAKQIQDAKQIQEVKKLYFKVPKMT